MIKKLSIKTGRPEFDEMCSLVESFLEKDTLDVVVDGQRIRGYRSPDAKSIWIRDHSDMLRSAKYFETDMKSVVQHFADTQSANGRIFDYFTTFPEKLPSERENWTKYVRVPVEADVEFRFVKAAFLTWQATGDDLWIEKLLPGMEKALDYATSHPWRWDQRLGLVKRAYTIDTWDFAYTAGKHDWLQFQIDDETFWGIMHGDNSGYYEAFRIMETLCRFFQRGNDAEMWKNRAEAIKAALDRTCWNGRFYTHFVKLTPVKIDGVDESQQLSLSNPMNINRGAVDHAKAVSIICEYMKRKSMSKAFAEWFSIDPPFPAGIFGDELLKPGVYANGGIMPLVGGELAKAAFDNGFERYGVDILKRYYRMIAESGETYLWYSPDGKSASVETSTSPDAQPTDGWGSSAMLYALVEGLAGVEDRLKQYRKARLSPRWHAAGIDRAQVCAGYPASDSWINYTYLQGKDRIELEVECGDCEIEFHVLMPADSRIKSVDVGDKSLAFKTRVIEESHYVDFDSEVNESGRVIISLDQV